MNRTNKRKNELLSPAGTYECFCAAIVAGADAVYLGLKDFGARKNAGNFTEEELVKALEEAHLRDVKIYLTVNTLFKDDEFEGLYNALKVPYIHGLDGVIVQDIGVVSFIQKSFPGLEVHASTQMAITDVAGARFAKEFGMTRIVPARELSLKEIKKIHDETGIEIEGFIHGAMCYSYSGKCLFSSFLGERSGNRGLCAQPCRLMYDNEYLLSMKDLCTLRNIPDLINAGVYSFKIEGRMKSPEYVANVTKIYRKYIDLYFSGQEYIIDKEDEDKLISIYTRGGNSNAYLFEKNNKDLITFNSPAYASNDTKEKIKVSENDFEKIPVSIDVFLNPEENVFVSAKCTLFDGSEENVQITFEEKAQVAKSNPLSDEAVIKQFSKSGGTPFVIDDINVYLGENVFMPNGQLNSLRRQILEELRNKILQKYRRKDDYELSKCGYSNQGISNNLAVNVLASSVYMLSNILSKNGVTGLIIPYSLVEAVTRDKKALELIANRKENLNIYIQLPFIIRDIKKGVTEVELISSLKEWEDKFIESTGAIVKGYYISNFESLYLLKKAGFDKEIIGDIHMYCMNKYSKGVLNKKGVLRTTAPVELTFKELLRRNVTGEEYIVYGRMPMMVSSSCIINSKDKCNYKKDGHLRYITDRKNARLPVKCICNECTNVIYNSVATSLIKEINNIKRLNPSGIRLDFIDENDREIDEILNALFRALKDKDGNIEMNLEKSYTKGHFNRGVL